MELNIPMFNRKYILKGSIFQPAMSVSCLSLGVKVNFSDLNKPHCSNGVVEGSTLNMPLNFHWIYIWNINILWFIYIGQFSNLHLFLCGYVLSKTALKQTEFVGCCEKMRSFLGSFGSTSPWTLLQSGKGVLLIFMVGTLWINSV